MSSEPEYRDSAVFALRAAMALELVGVPVLGTRGLVLVVVGHSE